MVRQTLLDLKLVNHSGRGGENRFFVSDAPAKFKEVGSLFLGEPLGHVEVVDFEAFIKKLNI